MIETMKVCSSDIQAELEDRLRFETLLAELSARFVNLPPDQVDQEIEKALRCLVETLGADRSALGRLTEDGDDFVVTHTFAVPGVEVFPRVPALSTVAPLLSRTLLSGQPFVMPRLADLSEEGEQDRKLFASRRITSGMVVPLWVGGRVIGGLGCSLAHGEREWPEPVVRGMRLIADVFANALARQDTDRALQESEERMRLATAAAQIGLWIWDIPHDAIWVSERAQILYGFHTEEPISFRRFIASLHPEDRDRVEDAVQNTLRQCGDFREEYRVAYPAGGVRWLYAVGSCRLNAGGQPARMMGASLDITERREQEARLRNALEEIQRLQEQLQQENVLLRQEVKAIKGHARIVGQSPAIRRVLALVEQVAPTQSSVLLLGETGTGKELFATAIHDLSSRRNRRWCGELCGDGRAVRQRQGPPQFGKQGPVEQELVENLAEMMLGDVERLAAQAVGRGVELHRPRQVRARRLRIKRQQPHTGQLCMAPSVVGVPRQGLCIGSDRSVIAALGVGDLAAEKRDARVIKGVLDRCRRQQGLRPRPVGQSDRHQHTLGEEIEARLHRRRHGVEHRLSLGQPPGLAQQVGAGRGNLRAQAEAALGMVQHDERVRLVAEVGQRLGDRRIDRRPLGVMLEERGDQSALGLAIFGEAGEIKLLKEHREIAWFKSISSVEQFLGCHRFARDAALHA
ncbi:MAG: PAS domain-containing protein [Candidatus Competibacteraceae bacterium]|nr:PAS domain-containing protein [Candidatus Competibacteraceae bacterium]